MCSLRLHKENKYRANEYMCEYQAGHSVLLWIAHTKCNANDCFPILNIRIAECSWFHSSRSYLATSAKSTTPGSTCLFLFVLRDTTLRFCLYDVFMHNLSRRMHHVLVFAGAMLGQAHTENTVFSLASMYTVYWGPLVNVSRVRRWYVIPISIQTIIYKGCVQHC